MVVLAEKSILVAYDYGDFHILYSYTNSGGLLRFVQTVRKKDIIVDTLSFDSPDDSVWPFEPD